MSPPTTVGDAADMQLCVIKQGSPPVLGNVAFFVTDLLTLARCSVCIHFYWGGIAEIVNRKLFATGVPILPWMGPHVSFNST